MTQKTDPESLQQKFAELRVLVIDDSEDDALLNVAALKREGISLRSEVVSSRDSLKDLLARASFDVVLCDHNLGSWTGMDALTILQDSGKDIPFIVVTGSLGDEAAVEYVKRGASEYVLKQNTARLPSAVERALREKKQREEAERLRAQVSAGKKDWELTFDAVPSPILLLDADCRVLRANRAASEILEVPLQSMHGKPCCEVVHGLHERLDTCPHGRFLQTGHAERGDFLEPRLNMTFDMVCAPVGDPAGNPRGCVLVMRDITERKRAEKALQDSEAKYRGIVETAQEAIYMLDRENSIMFSNIQGAEMLGCSLLATLGQPLSQWIEEPERSEFLAGFEYSEPGAAQCYELTIRRNDGTTRWVLASAAPQFGDDGKFFGSLVMVSNHTERHALQLQLAQSQKMEAIGRLAGGVAHDFNNLVTIISGYSDLLLRRLAEQDPMRATVEEIRKAGDRAAGLTRQLLAFARRQVLQPQVLDLGAVVAGMEQMLLRLIGEDVDLTIVRGKEIGKVKADMGQIEQVIMNLAVNARDAMANGGKLLIETSAAELTNAIAHKHGELNPGRYVLLSVSDKGCGMDAATQSHIFEPFFTTKELGKGTGLGLSTVYGIVKQSGGNIWLYSEVGIGTTFKIYLPRVEDAAQIAPSVQARPETRQGSETILIAEDEAPLRALVCGVLAESGYKILEAEGARHAVQLAEAFHDPIHLLLTDVIMPQMNGRELASKIKQIHPETEVLFMSGYSDNAIAHHGVLEHGISFLEKPFSPEGLGRKVREILGSSD